MNKYLTIKGFNGEVDEERLFEYLANEEHLELVATERCVDHFLLEYAFSEEMRKHQESARKNRYDPPSVLWKQLFIEGAEALLGKWRADPATDVPGAIRRGYGKMKETEFSDWGKLHTLLDGYNAENSGVFLYGSQAFVVIHGCLCKGGVWDEKGGIFEGGCGCMTDLDDLWGLPYGDTCFVFASYALRLRGHNTLILETIERIEKFLRSKVWVTDIITDALVGNPPPKSIIEKAREVVMNHQKAEQ